MQRPVRCFKRAVSKIITMIRSAYAGSDWLLPHGLMGSESSSVVSAGDADSSSWLSGVTAPPDIEHSVRSSCEGHTFTKQMLIQNHNCLQKVHPHPHLYVLWHEGTTPTQGASAQPGTIMV